MTERNDSAKAVSTEPYKGVRDFYPEDQSVERHLFSKLSEMCERFGYEEYAASPLEPTELYLGKTSEEIVSEQTYTFEDRGGRSVTLRPEMTPTVARMIAARAKTLAFPVRLYTIANVFRYERPQRGRLREHFQLNADIFGSDSPEADAEIIALASEILASFGLNDTDFEVRIMSRELLRVVLKDGLDIDDAAYKKLLRLIDAKSKMDGERYREELRLILGDEKAERALKLWDESQGFGEDVTNTEAFKALNRIVDMLKSRGITNVSISKELVRGFDYYTGMIFEVFDTHPDNSRSLFGGGRYDNLMQMFDAPSVPAVGFGMGDVTLRDALEVRELLPVKPAPADLYVAVLDEGALDYAYKAARDLRREGVRVIQSLRVDTAAKHIKRAERAGVVKILFVGADEAENRAIAVKDLATGDQETLLFDEVLMKFKDEKNNL